MSKPKPRKKAQRAKLFWAKVFKAVQVLAFVAQLAKTLKDLFS